jgi:hypothetical protein
MKTALKSSILALFQSTPTSDFSSAIQILAPLPVIRPSQVFGWLSIAQFGQGSHRKVPSEQPLQPSGTPHTANA